MQRLPDTNDITDHGGRHIRWDSKNKGMARRSFLPVLDNLAQKFSSVYLRESQRLRARIQPPNIQEGIEYIIQAVCMGIDHLQHFTLHDRVPARRVPQQRCGASLDHGQWRLQFMSSQGQRLTARLDRGTFQGNIIEEYTAPQQVARCVPHRETAHAQPAYRRIRQGNICRRLLLGSKPGAIKFTLHTFWLGRQREQLFAHIKYWLLDQFMAVDAQQTHRAGIEIGDALPHIQQQETAAHIGSYPRENAIFL